MQRVTQGEQLEQTGADPIAEDVEPARGEYERQRRVRVCLRLRRSLSHSGVSRGPYSVHRRRMRPALSTALRSTNQPSVVLLLTSSQTLRSR